MDDGAAGARAYRRGTGDGPFLAPGAGRSASWGAATRRRIFVCPLGGPARLLSSSSSSPAPPRAAEGFLPRRSRHSRWVSSRARRAWTRVSQLVPLGPWTLLSGPFCLSINLDQDLCVYLFSNPAEPTKKKRTPTERSSSSSSSSSSLPSRRLIPSPHVLWPHP